MSLCVSVSEYNSSLIATDTPLSSCQSYVLVSASEYNQNNETILFNGDLFLYVSGVLLINMVVGHWTGRVVRIMSKR